MARVDDMWYHPPAMTTSSSTTRTEGPIIYLTDMDDSPTKGRQAGVKISQEATLTEVHLSEATLADLAANLSQLLEVYISVEECAMAVSDFCEALSNDGFLVFHRARESLG